jgi:VWFA-related protein
MTPLLALLPLALAASQASKSDLPTFAMALDVVRVDVSVTRDDVPVKGLTASSFEVLDDGVRQKVELVGQENLALHTVLLLDTSQSVAGPMLARLKAAAHQFVDTLRPDDALSLITFSECTDLAVTASRDRRAAHEALELAGTRLTTSLNDAALAALVVADPAQGRPLVLFFSDGEDVGSWTPAEKVLRLAKESEVVVHTVTPTDQAVPAFIQELTDATGGRIWRATEGSGLGSVFVNALEEFRNRYRLQYEPEGVKQAGWHKLEVRLKRTGGKVRARPGYSRRVEE